MDLKQINFIDLKDLDLIKGLIVMKNGLNIEEIKPIMTISKDLDRIMVNGLDTIIQEDEQKQIK